MSLFAAALLALLIAAPNGLSGQTAGPAGSLIPGARVRITQAGTKPRVAVLVARTADTVHVRWPEFSNPVPLPVAEISRLDVSTGRHRHVLRRMAIGTVTVGTLGAAVGAASYKPCVATEFLGCLLAPESRAQSAAFGGVLGGALGLVVGSLVGLQKQEDWKRVSLDEGRVALAVTPRAHGTRLGVAVQF